MKLADAHIHLFQRGFPGRYGALFPGGDLSVYEKMREVHSVGSALVVGYEGEPWARGNNRHIARLARLHSWMVPLAYSDPFHDVFPRRLVDRWRQGFAGLSLYVFKKEEVDALNGLPSESIDLLNRHRAIISLNSPPDVAVQLRPFLERLDKTRILLSHLGMPEKMSVALRQLRPVFTLAGLPHVGVKVSGAYALNAYPHQGLSGVVEKLSAAFGPSRLYWGSDFCPALDFVSFEQTINLGLPENFLPKEVYAGNLMKIMKRVQR